MNIGIDIIRKSGIAYTNSCKKIVNELNLPQTAFDILMFLGNHKEYKNAKDIVKYRKIKANLVSINVDKLVKEGYLIRKEVKDDKRIVELYLTDKAKPIYEKGAKMQKDFYHQLLKDVNEDEYKAFMDVLNKVDSNLEKIIKDNK